MTSSLHASKDSLELNHDQIMCHDENCCTENVVDDARGMNPTCHESATVFVQTFFSSQNELECHDIFSSCIQRLFGTESLKIVALRMWWMMPEA